MLSQFPFFGSAYWTKKKQQRNLFPADMAEDTLSGVLVSRGLSYFFKVSFFFEKFLDFDHPVTKLERLTCF